MKAEETNLNALPSNITTMTDTINATTVHFCVRFCHVVPPNSNMKLRMPLTNLTPEERAGAIISTYFFKVYVSSSYCQHDNMAELA